jgi:hypothetical protein
VLRVIEVVCSDAVEHRRRVEQRRADIDGHEVPTWQQIVDREYEPWSEERLVLDTSRTDLDCVAAVEQYVTRGPGRY